MLGVKSGNAVGQVIGVVGKVGDRHAQLKAGLGARDEQVFPVVAAIFCGIHQVLGFLESVTRKRTDFLDSRHLGHERVIYVDRLDRLVVAQVVITDPSLMNTTLVTADARNYHVETIGEIGTFRGNATAGAVVGLMAGVVRHENEPTLDCFGCQLHFAVTPPTLTVISATTRTVTDMARSIFAHVIARWRHAGWR